LKKVDENFYNQNSPSCYQNGEKNEGKTPLVVFPSFSCSARKIHPFQGAYVGKADMTRFACPLLVGIAPKGATANLRSPCSLHALHRATF
jgi:hypothetical protein